MSAPRPPQAPPADAARSVLRSPRRLALAAAGLVCVGLALVGVVVPGLPTTVFLIAASYLFAKSCPWLEERIFRMPVFRPFVPYVRGERGIPRRARAMALLSMWGAVSVSLATLFLTDRLAPWIAALIVAAAAVGTYCILAYRPRAVAVGTAGPHEHPSPRADGTRAPTAR